MSGIIDAIDNVVSAFSKLIDKSVNAFYAILVSFLVGIVIAAIVGVSFDVVKSTVDGNSAAEGAVEAGRAVYDFGSFVQDLYEYGKIIGAVVAAGIGLFLAMKTLLRKANLID